MSHYQRRDNRERETAASTQRLTLKVDADCLRGSKRKAPVGECYLTYSEQKADRLSDSSPVEVVKRDV